MGEGKKPYGNIADNNDYLNPLLTDKEHGLSPNLLDCIKTAEESGESNFSYLILNTPQTFPYADIKTYNRTVRMPVTHFLDIEEIMVELDEITKELDAHSECDAYYNALSFKKDGFHIRFRSQDVFENVLEIALIQKIYEKSEFLETTKKMSYLANRLYRVLDINENIRNGEESVVLRKMI